MKVRWVVTKSDVRRLQEFYTLNKKNGLVKRRIKKNLVKQKPKVSKTRFWRAMVNCLLTTQQPSGPDSAISKFMKTKPFPLKYGVCNRKKEIRKYAAKHLQGFRRWKNIAKEMDENLQSLRNGLWREMLRKLDSLRSVKDASPEKEREVAEFIRKNLKGFGPKQARNLLQMLGLTLYEIPIDSRITKWLNELGFPVHLSAKALSDPHYYDFVLDGFQLLCDKGGVYPCVMDAAIFSSFDNKGKSAKSNHTIGS